MLFLIGTFEMVGVLVIAILFGYMLFKLSSASRMDKQRKDETRRM